MTLEIEKIGSSKPWVARLTGTDPQWGFQREFMNGIADFSRANRPKTRGVYYLFTLPPGVYEVKGGSSWKSAGDRKFILVTGDASQKIGMAEVLASFPPDPA